MSVKKKYFDRDGLQVKPLPTEKKRLQKALRDVSRHTRKRLLKADPSDGDTPFDGKYEMPKRVVYQIGKHCLTTGNTKVLAKLAMEGGSRDEEGDGSRPKEKWPDRKTNPFFYAYRLIVGTTSMTVKDQKRGISIDRGQRFKGAVELCYAERHNVPVELLKGFIQQSGGHAAVYQKLKEDQCEPWCDWKRNLSED